MNFAAAALPAFAAHICTAAAAKQFGGQQIIFLCLMTGRGFLVFGEFSLYAVKEFFGNDGWDAVRYNDIAEGVLTDVASIVQHALNTVVIDISAVFVFDALFLKEVDQLLHGCSLNIALEGFQNEGSSQWVDLKVLFFVNHVADGH